MQPTRTAAVPTRSDDDTTTGTEYRNRSKALITRITSVSITSNSTNQTATTTKTRMVEVPFHWTELCSVRANETAFERVGDELEQTQPITSSDRPVQ